MSALRTVFAAIFEAMAPDGTMARLRARGLLDTVTTLVVMLLAVVLAVGYQVFGRWARRQVRDG